jgi:hypothetical protein
MHGFTQQWNDYRAKTSCTEKTDDSSPEIRGCHNNIGHGPPHN